MSFEPGPFHRRFGAALALVSMAILALQVAATRMFSYMLWYHFAFFVITVALLGFTAGGLAAQAFRKRWARAPARVLEGAAMAAAATTLLLFVVLTRVPLTPSFLGSAAQIAMFLGVVAALLLPFFFCGLWICLALSLWARHIHSLYAVNLIGSGAGCLAVVALLDHLGVAASLLASGFLLWLAALACVSGIRSPGRVGWRLLVTAAGIGLVALATDELHPLVYVRSAKLTQLSRERILQRRSDSLSSVDVFVDRERAAVWGLSNTWTGAVPERVCFAIDSWALTAAWNRGQTEGPGSILEYLPPASVYALGPMADVLVIGCGGGVDVLTALHYGARHVTAVDINPLIVNATRRDYAGIAGHLYDDPRVEVHVAEGRHFLRRDRRKYDLIQLSGVDTYAASQAGAFALHENYLYTREALGDYFNALKPGGIVTFTRWLYDPPRQTLKLVAIVDRALRERGASHPERHLAVFRSAAFSLLVIGAEPLAAGQIERLLDHAETMRFEPVYLPDREVNPFPDLAANPFYEYWRVGAAAYTRNYPYDIRPSTDDRPFFFEHHRWSRLLAPDPIFWRKTAQGVLLATLAVAAVMGAAIVTAARFRSRGLPATLGRVPHLYLVSIGLGYIFVENVLIQKLILYLGRPSYSLSVILFSLLCFSGLGSHLGGRVAGLRRRPRALLAAIPVILVAYAFGLRPLLDAAFGFALFPRVVTTVLLLAPVGTLMGMPFPGAIRRLAAGGEELVPWAWVINGSASALAGALTIMLGIAFGFTWVLLAAAGLYAVAALLWGKLGPAAGPTGDG